MAAPMAMVATCPCTRSTRPRVSPLRLGEDCATATSGQIQSTKHAASGSEYFVEFWQRTQLVGETPGPKCFQSGLLLKDASWGGPPMAYRGIAVSGKSRPVGDPVECLRWKSGIRAYAGVAPSAGRLSLGATYALCSLFCLADDLQDMK